MGGKRGGSRAEGRNAEYRGDPRRRFGIWRLGLLWSDEDCHAVGQVLEALDRLKLAERTIVVGMSVQTRMRRRRTVQKRQIRQRQETSMQPDIKYEIIHYWSAEDQAFIAEVPELAGCSADGATYQETLAKVELVIRQWIETAREIGRAILAPRGRLLYA
jgi:predicted RNase H-like HicB family nuclease